MPRGSLAKRLEIAESAVKTHSSVLEDCICFPRNEPPFFCEPYEQAIAARLKCPLHGDRLQPRLHIYVSRWRREKEPARRELLSPQYRKAWEATFPSHLWPAEEVKDGSRLSLSLKNGKRIVLDETQTDVFR